MVLIFSSGDFGRYGEDGGGAGGEGDANKQAMIANDTIVKNDNLDSVSNSVVKRPPNELSTSMANKREINHRPRRQLAN